MGVRRIPVEKGHVTQFPESKRQQAAAKVEPKMPQLVLQAATKKFDGGLTTKRRVVVLGIDSSAAGWAITAQSVEDDTFYSWMFHSKYTGQLRIYDLGGFIVQQLKSIRMQTGGIEHIVMEGYGFASQMAHTIGEIGGLTKYLLLCEFGYAKPLGYPTYLTPSQLKKFVTGHGGSAKNPMPKSQVIAHVLKATGIHFTDDNLCDSWCCAQVSKALYVGPSNLLSHQKEVLANLSEHPEWPMNQQQSKHTRR